MAFDFDEVKETVRAVAVRLDSPFSDYSMVFSESDEAVEVRVDDTMGSPIFIFAVDSERFRVIKALELDPNGYASFSYHSCVELVSFILEYFYPVFYRLNHHASVMDMLSRVFNKKIRIWKDLVSTICQAGDLEYYDFGHSVSVLGVNFSYDLGSNNLSVSGVLEESLRCPSVMELVTALLTFLSFIFNREDLEINPILQDQLVDEGEDSFDMDAMMDTMSMGDDIDAAGPDGLDAGPEGEDLSEEFVPAEEGLDSATPDIDQGKDAILDDVLEG